MDIRILQRVVKTATSANTPGLHKNRISVQTVRNCLRFTSSLTQCHHQNQHMYTHIGYSDAGIPIFRMNQDFLYNVVMAGCACTVGEMNAMLTVVFLNDIVSGVGVPSWSGQPLPRLLFTTSH